MPYAVSTTVSGPYLYNSCLIHMHFTLRRLVLVVTLALNESGVQARASLKRPAFSSADAAVILDPLTDEFKIGCRATGERDVRQPPCWRP